MEKEHLQRRRDLALRFLVLGVVLLLVFGLGYASSGWLAFGGGGFLLWIFTGNLALYIFAAIIALCAVSMAAWMFWGFRLRVEHDPWKYDPELDGPDPRVRRGLEDAEEAPPAGFPPRP